MASLVLLNIVRVCITKILGWFKDFQTISLNIPPDVEAPPLEAVSLATTDSGERVKDQLVDVGGCLLLNYNVYSSFELNIPQKFTNRYCFRGVISNPDQAKRFSVPEDTARLHRIPTTTDGVRLYYVSNPC